MAPWRLNKYALQIAQGAVFAYPTDTIWGLGCHPENQAAIQRILSIKNRPFDKGMILLSSNIDYCRSYIDTEYYRSQYHQIATPDSYPSTWLLPASTDCPTWLTGTNSTVAIRITGLTHISTICDKITHPLISTSANISGHKPASNAYLIHKHFQNKVDFIISGIHSGSRHASRIIDKRTGEIIRP